MKNSYHNDMLNLGWELKIKKINEKRLLKNLKNKKKNEERQYTLGWEYKKMLDFDSWTIERHKRREEERRSPNYSAHSLFILGFTNRIVDGILNIKIFKIFINFVYKVKLKISIYTKILRNPSKYYRWFFILSMILLVKE
jgi:hypothetical protein